MAGYIALIDGKAGAYGVVVPDLPGCTAMGETMGRALDNAAAALCDWVEVTKESGVEVPCPSNLGVLRRDPEVRRALAVGANLVISVLRT